MKQKLLYMLFGCGLMFSACEDNAPDSDTGDIILFSSPAVAVESSSRAELVQSALPEGSVFSVYGYCIPLIDNQGGTSDDRFNPTGGEEAWNAKKDLITPDVINGAELKVDRLGCYYTGTPARWYTPNNPRVRKEADPVDFKYSFIAFAPSGENFGITHPLAGAPTLSYKVSYPCEEDAMYSFLTDHKREWGAVDLQFRHILTALSVQFNNYNRDEDIVVNSLELEGDFYTDASIDFSEPDPTVRVNDGALAAATMQFVSQPVTVAREASAKGQDTFFVLANSHGTESNYLGSSKVLRGSITYKGQTIDIRIPKEGSNFNFGRVPLPGVNYTLNINFIGNDIMLMLTADDVEYWESGSDSNTIIE
ncbi:MAG: fimbrillin family protein [Paramuribaculum sp.]|nr:fimbrillin family protein [Paramuribaculum sp.]